MAKTDFLAPAELRIVGSRMTLSGEAQFSLASMSTAKIPNGALIYVQSVKAYFELVKNSTATPDGITVLAPPFGEPGNWHRKPSDYVGDSPWLQQSAWYISPLIGSDENDGGVSAPLATFAEFVRRLGPDPVITQYIDVSILDDLEEILDMSAKFSGDTATLRIHGGVVNILASDTISAWQAPGATGLEGQITGTAITDFSVYDGRRLRIVGGTYDGYTAWLTGISQSAVGNEIGRVGVMAALTGTGDISTDYVTDLSNSPAPGDGFQIQDLVRVKGTNLRSHRLDAGSSSALFRLGFVISDLEINSASGETMQTYENDAREPGQDGSAIIFRCSMQGTLRGEGAVALIGVMPGVQGEAGGLDLYNTRCKIVGSSGGSYRAFDSYLSSVGTGTYIDKDMFELRDFTRVGSFNLSAWQSNGSPGLRIEEGSVVQSLNLLAGNLPHASSDGVVCRGRCYYSNAANLTITVGNIDVVLGTTTPQNLAFGALPAQNTIAGGQDDDAIMALA